MNHQPLFPHDLPHQHEKRADRRVGTRMRERQVVGVACVGEAEARRSSLEAGVEAAAKQIRERGRRTRALRRGALSDRNEPLPTIKNHGDAW